MNDRRTEIKELLASIGETQTWLGEQLGLSKQVISQKMNAKTVKLDFFEKAIAVIGEHPKFKGSTIGHTVNHHGVISEEVFSELQRTVREQAELIGTLKEKIRWMEDIILKKKKC